MENQNSTQVTSVKDWAIRIFLASLPLIGLIYYSFGPSETMATKSAQIGQKVTC